MPRVCPKHVVHMSAVSLPHASHVSHARTGHARARHASRTTEAQHADGRRLHWQLHYSVVGEHARSEIQAQGSLPYPVRALIHTGKVTYGILQSLRPGRQQPHECAASRVPPVPVSRRGA